MKDKKSLMLFVMMLVALIGLLWLVFLPGCRDESAAGKVAMDVPEGIAEDIPESKREAYQEKGRKSVSTDEYFEMLMAEEEISLVSSEKIPGQAGNDGVTGKGGSAAERVFGPAPVERSVPRQPGGSSGSGGSAGAGGYSGAVRQRQMSEEEQLEYDRKRAEMVRDVITRDIEVVEFEQFVPGQEYDFLVDKLEFRLVGNEVCGNFHAYLHCTPEEPFEHLQVLLYRDIHHIEFRTFIGDEFAEFVGIPVGESCLWGKGHKVLSECIKLLGCTLRPLAFNSCSGDKFIKSLVKLKLFLFGFGYACLRCVLTSR